MPEKVTFGELREMGLRGVLIYCADYHCSHSIAISAERWRDDVRLGHRAAVHLHGRGKRGSDVRPDFSSNKGRSARSG